VALWVVLDRPQPLLEVDRRLTNHDWHVLLQELATLLVLNSNFVVEAASEAVVGALGVDCLLVDVE